MVLFQRKKASKPPGTTPSERLRQELERRKKPPPTPQFNAFCNRFGQLAEECAGVLTVFSLDLVAVVAGYVAFGVPRAMLTPNVFKFGGKGKKRGQFVGGVQALALTSDGVLLVGDSSRVQRFNEDGICLGPFGDAHSQPNIRAIAVHPLTGDVYVSVLDKYAINIYQHDGAFRGTLGQRVRASGLAFAKGGKQLLAADEQSHWVIEYNDKFEEVAERAMHMPYGLAVNAVDELFVTSNAVKGCHITVLNADRLRDRYIGASGRSIGCLSEARGIAVEPRTQKLIVCDAGNRRMTVFGPNGVFCMSFGEGVLRRPTGVVVSGEGRIIVADCEASSVFVFAFDA